MSGQTNDGQVFDVAFLFVDWVSTVAISTYKPGKMASVPCTLDQNQAAQSVKKGGGYILIIL